MRYYVYVSESKVEMLYSQIGTKENQQREESVGFDLKILKAEVKDSKGIPANKYTRLDAIANKLDDEGLIGSLNDEKPYIRCRLKMKWGVFYASNITFWAYENENLAFGLAGSSYHLLGEQRKGGTNSRSYTDWIVKWMNSQFVDKPNPNPVSHINEEVISKATYLAIRQMWGSEALYEFVAKVLHRGEDERVVRSDDSEDTYVPVKVLLATPLYVALEE